MNLDSATIEIPAGAAPAVILRYNFWTALYHRLVAKARDFRISGRCSDANWAGAVREVAALYVPLNPFSWLEYALSSVDNVEALQDGLSDRAVRLAAGIGNALASVADDYRARLWDDDYATLNQALNELHNHLYPVKDVLLTKLASQFDVDLGSASYEVSLVPHCHESVGAYSHPTVIGVDRFTGISLLEVLVHELGHVAVDRAGRVEVGGFASVRAACERLGRTERFALELFHLVLFHASGQLIRSVVDPNYQTLASRRNIYAKLGLKLGARLTEHDVQAIWNRREKGEIGLDVVIEELDSKLKSGLHK